MLPLLVCQRALNFSANLHRRPERVQRVEGPVSPAGASIARPLPGACFQPGIGRMKTPSYIPLRRGRHPRRPLPHYRHLHAGPCALISPYNYIMTYKRTSPHASTVIARSEATRQSVSPAIVTPSVGEGLDPPDTGAQCRTG